MVNRCSHEGHDLRRRTEDPVSETRESITLVSSNRHTGQCTEGDTTAADRAYQGSADQGSSTCALGTTSDCCDGRTSPPRTNPMTPASTTAATAIAIAIARRPS